MRGGSRRGNNRDSAANRTKASHRWKSVRLNSCSRPRLCKGGQDTAKRLSLSWLAENRHGSPCPQSLKLVPPHHFSTWTPSTSKVSNLEKQGWRPEQVKTTLVGCSDKARISEAANAKNGRSTAGSKAPSCHVHFSEVLDTFSPDSRDALVKGPQPASMTLLVLIHKMMMKSYYKPVPLT